VAGSLEPAAAILPAQQLQAAASGSYQVRSTQAPVVGKIFERPAAEHERDIAKKVF
jgi:hypothetical protein